MNIGLIKIGTRLHNPYKQVNGNFGEYEKFINLFINSNYSINVIKKINKNDYNPRKFFNYDNIWHIEIDDVYLNINELNLDALFVIGGTLNFFGGIDGLDIAKSYKAINIFKGPIFYLYTDPNCQFKQLWNDNYFKRNEKNGTNYTAKDLYIDKPNIIMLSSDTNLDRLNKNISKKGYVKFEKMYAFEWQKLVATNKQYNAFLKEHKKYDLIYGGYYRSGARHKQMVEYFHDTEYSAKMFGQMTKDLFECAEISKYPEYLEESKGWDFFHEQTNTALATIVFAEDTYNDGIITMRVYASILSNTAVFIENKYDPKHVIFPDAVFDSFNYVSNKKELEEKIRYLKTLSTEEYDAICKKQIDSIKSINADLIYEQFRSIVNTYAVCSNKESEYLTELRNKKFIKKMNNKNIVADYWLS